jgi:hypothetical protein
MRRIERPAQKADDHAFGRNREPRAHLKAPLCANLTRSFAGAVQGCKAEIL